LEGNKSVASGPDLSREISALLCNHDEMKNTHENMHPVQVHNTWLRLCSAFRMRAHLCSAQKDSYGTGFIHYGAVSPER